MCCFVTAGSWQGRLVGAWLALSLLAAGVFYKLLWCKHQQRRKAQREGAACVLTETQEEGLERHSSEEETEWETETELEEEQQALREAREVEPVVLEGPCVGKLLDIQPSQKPEGSLVGPEEEMPCEMMLQVGQVRGGVGIEWREWTCHPANSTVGGRRCQARCGRCSRLSLSVRSHLAAWSTREVSVLRAPPKTRVCAAACFTGGTGGQLRGAGR